MGTRHALGAGETRSVEPSSTADLIRQEFHTVLVKSSRFVACRRALTFEA